MVESRISVFQPCRSAKRRYMRSRSPANSADSSPPSPAFTSRMTSLASLASLGTSSSSQPVLEFRPAPPQLLGFLGERGVLARQLVRGGLVGADALPLAVGVHDRAELAVPPAQRPGAVGVSVDGGIGEIPL